MAEFEDDPARRTGAKAQAKREDILLGVDLTPKAPGRLADFANFHLDKKAKEGAETRVTDDWLAMHQKFLERAVDYFGADRPLRSIDVVDVVGFVDYLRTVRVHRKPVKPGEPLFPGNATQGREPPASPERPEQPVPGRRLALEGRPAGHNPVAAMDDKPAGATGEAAWLEVDDAALLLEAARTLPTLATGAIRVGSAIR